MQKFFFFLNIYMSLCRNLKISFDKYIGQNLLHKFVFQGHWVAF